MNDLSNWITEKAESIRPVSEEWRARASQRLDTLTKPLGSLGRLEAVAAQFVAIRGERWHEPIRKGVYIFAADHGVTAEGVSAYPSEVTRQMVLNFAAGGAAVNVLARLHGAELAVIDVGVVGDLDGGEGLHHHKVARGTKNFLREVAMSDEEVLAALRVGASMASYGLAAGQNLVGIGEMGIGNTTSASAITCALTGASAADVTGKGTGVQAAIHAHKISVVEGAVRMHFGLGDASPTDVLRKVGGLEIAAVAGMILGCAEAGIAVIVDGFIATSAAALAAAMVPACRGYMIAGHRSEEPGHRVLLEHLALVPLLSLEMRLGEGTGAVLAMPIVESAVALYREMATFASAGVSEASA